MASAAPAPGDGLAAPNGTMPLNGTAPPIPPGILVSGQAAYLAQVFIGVTSTLMALCIITFGTRIYQRVVPVWKVGLDDYFIVAGFVSLHQLSTPFLLLFFFFSSGLILDSPINTLTPIFIQNKRS